MLTSIFPATQRAPVVDTAEKGRAVKIRAQPIRIPRHVERPIGIVFVKTLFYFLLRQGKHIRAAAGPARWDFRRAVHKGIRLKVVLQPVYLSVNHYHIPERNRKDFFFFFIRTILRLMFAARHTFPDIVLTHPLRLIPLKNIRQKSRSSCWLLYQPVLKQISFLWYIKSQRLAISLLFSIQCAYHSFAHRTFACFLSVIFPFYKHNAWVPTHRAIDIIGFAKAFLITISQCWFNKKTSHTLFYHSTCSISQRPSHRVCFFALSTHIVCFFAKQLSTGNQRLTLFTYE